MVNVGVCLGEAAARGWAAWKWHGVGLGVSSVCGIFGFMWFVLLSKNL